MNQLDLNITNEESINMSIILDPFQTDCVTNVGIHFNNSGITNPYWYGYVKFKNGNTEGEQRTNKTKTFEEIVVEIRQILNSLNQK